MFDIQFKLSTAPFIDFSVFDSPSVEDAFQDAFTSAKVSQKTVTPRFVKVEEGSYRDLSVATTKKNNTPDRDGINSKKSSFVIWTAIFFLIFFNGLCLKPGIRLLFLS